MLRKADTQRILGSVETLGEILLDWRLKAGLNQSDAARRCGVTPQHWWLLENDQRPNVSGDTIDKLARGTGYAAERLLIAAHRIRHKQSALMPATA